MSEIIRLTQAERMKFSAWLEQDAESNEAMATQWESMGHPRSDVVTKMLRGKAAIFLTVAKELLAIESMAIGEHDE